ncbi:hypothetical protein Gohar_026000 [Gossypium harknessii]|uniref:Uncharacterized protein n=3 Tax=Gossypium TaxID=3633 RepID=A0A7J9KEW7_9ROSI|nr:hypothetical protein [Gossypium raimondii]MBA0812002.1 hypothetical protein [Gossypium harknessii]MBA0845005.1 hypothetical protein [Gossypium armourianum]
MKMDALDILMLRTHRVCPRGQMKLPALLPRHVLKQLKNVGSLWWICGPGCSNILTGAKLILAMVCTSQRKATRLYLRK